MTTSRTLLRRGLPALGVIGALLAGTVTGAEASSHREAPLITEDPVADLTDVYAFVSPDKPDTVTLDRQREPVRVAGRRPELPQVRRRRALPAQRGQRRRPVADLQYQFKFTTTYANPNTFLYNTNQVTSLNDPDLNVKQTYSVEVNNDTGKPTTLGTNLPVAPANVGPRSNPELRGEPRLEGGHRGRRRHHGLRRSSRRSVLRRPRQHLRPRRSAAVQPGPPHPAAERAGQDYVAGFNVHSFALQIPKSRARRQGDPVIGVWATTYRRAERVLARPGVLPLGRLGAGGPPRAAAGERGGHPARR